MVAVVNQAFVKAKIGDRNPLGLHIALPTDRCPKCEIEIVGVSANARYGKLTEEPDTVVYLPFGQGASDPVSRMVFELRTAGNPLLYANTVRQIVHLADARVPVDEVKTQDMLIDGMIGREITFARLCTAFAMLALAIACVGLYGTVSYQVARRKGEIGIRMALGAQRGFVVWMVLREVLALAAVGLALSVPVALRASKVVESFLFGVKPKDPVAMSAAAVTLLCAALLAGYVPARQASRIDPMKALRHE
jgi:predicted lysophospholipase L1 biosynthesis ABC-type transport system permease subunit